MDVQKQFEGILHKLTRAPLKPQQRLFALRVIALPGIYHELALGKTHLSVLKKLDKLVRSYTRKWLDLPMDTPKAYFHADYKDGGLSIPSMRWVIPELRKRRLQNLKLFPEGSESLLEEEVAICTRRLLYQNRQLDNLRDIKAKWAAELHASVDGAGLSQFSKIHQQHQWIIEGTRFLSGRDFLRACKLRINALPTRSRCARGRAEKDRMCRAGCDMIKTLNHVKQICHRTHDARVQRHGAVATYLVRKLRERGFTVEEEPIIQTAEGRRKPDILAVKGNLCYVLDTQVVGDRVDLD